MELENGYYHVRYYYWTIGKFCGNGWLLIGIERTFSTEELHEIGEPIKIPGDKILSTNFKIDSE